MTAIIVGGSSGLGRALCEEIAARGCDIVMVASGREDCERLASHLRLLHGITVRPLALDARDPVAFRNDLASALEQVGPVTDLFLPIGLASDDDRVGEAERRLEDIWPVNFSAVVLTIELVLPLMPPERGRIVGFGSIAAVRPRNRNLQYAAAKGALRSYFAGLRHALAGSRHVAQFYIVGYIASGQSFGKTQLFPPISARHAARLVLKDGDKDFGDRFLPRYWTIVALLLRWLPWRIFSRLDV